MAKVRSQWQGEDRYCIMVLGMSIQHSVAAFQQFACRRDRADQSSMKQQRAQDSLNHHVQRSVASQNTSYVEWLESPVGVEQLNGNHESQIA